MNENKMVGKRISELLEFKGMTQSELAKKAHITDVSMSRYVNGNRMPKASILANIATILGTTTEYLLGHEVPEDFDTEYARIHRLIARNARNMNDAQKNALVKAILFES